MICFNLCSLQFLVIFNRFTYVNKTATFKCTQVFCTTIPCTKIATLKPIWWVYEEVQTFTRVSWWQELDWARPDKLDLQAQTYKGKKLQCCVSLVQIFVGIWRSLEQSQFDHLPHVKAAHTSYGVKVESKLVVLKMSNQVDGLKPARKQDKKMFENWLTNCSVRNTWIKRQKQSSLDTEVTIKMKFKVCIIP